MALTVCCLQVAVPDDISDEIGAQFFVRPLVPASSGFER